MTIVLIHLTGDYVAGTNTGICCLLEYCDMPPNVLACSHSFTARSMTAQCRLQKPGQRGS